MAVPRGSSTCSPSPSPAVVRMMLMMMIINHSPNHKKNLLLFSCFISPIKRFLLPHITYNVSTIPLSSRFAIARSRTVENQTKPQNGRDRSWHFEFPVAVAADSILRLGPTTTTTTTTTTPLCHQHRLSCRGGDRWDQLRPNSGRYDEPRGVVAVSRAKGSRRDEKNLRDN